MDIFMLLLFSPFIFVSTKWYFHKTCIWIFVDHFNASFIISKFFQDPFAVKRPYLLNNLLNSWFIFIFEMNIYFHICKWKSFMFRKETMSPDIDTHAQKNLYVLHKYIVIYIYICIYLCLCILCIYMCVCVYMYCHFSTYPYIHLLIYLDIFQPIISLKNYDRIRVS